MLLNWFEATLRHVSRHTFFHIERVKHWYRSFLVDGSAGNTALILSRFI